MATSYAWARHTDVANTSVSQLTPAEGAGLRYALELTLDAQQRAEHTLAGEETYPPLTIAELADRDDLSAAAVRSMIRRARHRLFGNLTDSAIYKRKQRRPAIPIEAERRACAHPGCPHQLPSYAAPQRRYCNEHRTGRARTRRSRKRSSESRTAQNLLPPAREGA